MHKENKQQKLRGFTLLEVMIALAIFAGLLTGISGVFGTFVKNYKNVKEVQKNLENAQYVMNIVAKELRTSALVSPTDNPDYDTEITVHEYSKNKCMRFAFTGGNLTQAFGVATPTTSADCLSMTYGTAEKMINQTGNSSTSGKFLFPRPTSSTGASWKVGVITLLMDVGDQTNKKDLVHIQTTVSMRDYDSL